MSAPGSTIKVKGYVNALRSSFDGAPVFFVSQVDCAGPDVIYSQRIEIEHTLPADWNPIEVQTRALNEAKAKALADYQRTVAEINERLSKLQALTNGAQS